LDCILDKAEVVGAQILKDEKHEHKECVGDEKCEHIFVNKPASDNVTEGQWSKTDP
jgi:hypothetical protein